MDTQQPNSVQEATTTAIQVMQRCMERVDACAFHAGLLPQLLNFLQGSTPMWLYLPALLQHRTHAVRSLKSDYKILYLLDSENRIHMVQEARKKTIAFDDAIYNPWLRYLMSAFDLPYSDSQLITYTAAVSGLRRKGFEGLDGGIPLPPEALREVYNWTHRPTVITQLPVPVSPPNTLRQEPRVSMQVILGEHVVIEIHDLTLKPQDICSQLLESQFYQEEVLDHFTEKQRKQLNDHLAAFGFWLHGPPPGDVLQDHRKGLDYASWISSEASIIYSVIHPNALFQATYGGVHV